MNNSELTSFPGGPTGPIIPTGPGGPCRKIVTINHNKNTKTHQIKNTFGVIKYLYISHT